MIGGEKTPEKEERREPKYAEVQDVAVNLPEAGETLKAVVTKLGMTNAGEVFGEEAESPENPIILVFFENKDEGVHGKTPLGYYKHPTVRTHLFKFVRKFGQPKVGMEVRLIRDEKGYWGIDL